MSVSEVLAYPAVQGFIGGALAALLVDIRAWQSWGDVAFNWRTASWRWLQGGTLSALGAAGIAGLATL